MESDSIGLIIILVILIICSAFFSGCETAFTSCNRIKLKSSANNGDKRAKMILEILEDYNKFLTTVLIGNNIVNITSASLATVLFINLFSETLGESAVTLSTTIMTVVVLIFGEISPKILAKENSEGYAKFFAPFIKILIFCFTPLNFLFSLWKKFIYLFCKKNNDKSITDEEILTIVEEATIEGGIDEQESELIKSAISFTDVQVKDILCPRVDVVAVPITVSLEEVAKIFKETEYSRLPIYDGSIDNIIGVVNEKDFHNHLSSDIQSIVFLKKDIVYTTENTKIYDLLTLLQKEKSHMAVVSDEYGGTAGIVTLEDIIEELVGEIWDEHDDVEEEFIILDETHYKLLGSLSLEKFNSLLHTHLGEDMGIDTIGGYLISVFEDIPESESLLEIDNLKFILSKVENRRVVEISLELLEKSEN